MDFIKDKASVMVKKLEALKLIKRDVINYEFVECPEYKRTNTPPPADADWQQASSLQRYTGKDNHYWLHMSLDAVDFQDGKEVRLSVKTGREGMWDATNPQITVFINGKTVQAMDVNHTWIPLEFNKKYDVYMYLYTGMAPGDFGVEPSVDIVDLKIESLYYDIRIPLDSMNQLDENSYNYIKIREALDKATLLLDLRNVYSDNFYKSIDDCAKYMNDEFYGKICGKDSQGVLSCTGHTHIDVAWLWTVAQTREKAQRSFSTVLNMMKRYDNYSFFSSQPQLYQFVKEDDPELYEQIKERISEGRWEAEGAMWLEADTNLASGESLIRQIIHGKRFMKEEFGIDNHILWLPDVFGYSGAVPQILRKTGITKFFTTKLFWNDTDAMPDDIFEWEGIDGSCIFTQFIPGYVLILTPENAKNVWETFKNKRIIDETMFNFGYGDGGGGPTYDMMETFERMKHGIPGMPKLIMQTATDHLDKAEKEFYSNTTKEYSRPRWVGEIYFEMHRGTYTSVSKNKKFNRKSELLYQEVEAASATDMVLCGGSYPADLLEKHQKTILLNQFHDIIPGSSIKEVYDVTDVEYAEILSDGRKMTDSAIDSIKKSVNTDGGIFVYNPTPFTVSDYVDVDGNTYFAQDVPAHGWKVIKNKTDDTITVGDKLLENDVIRVKFNDKYNIISVYDKTEEREVLADGAEANRLELFEDYPRDYDAWEISDYYKQKMWIIEDVSSVEMLDNGFKIVRNYSNSKIIQDIVLNPGSKRIDFKTHIDWYEDHVLLKAAFPVDIHNTNATYDIQFGSIERPTHKNTSWDAAKFEVCAHKWADLSEDGYGVSILNDCKYGYNVEENIMKITLLKCATAPHIEADRGEHEFVYSMYPHSGNHKTGGTVKEGYLLNMPLEASAIPKTAGNLPDCYSFINSDKENVVIETIKKAEDDNSIIVRMYDAFNRKTTANITTGFDFSEVYICDMLENNECKLDSDNRTVKVKVKNFEIVTLKFVL